jgi:flagellar basal-body rod protein FlgF
MENSLSVVLSRQGVLTRQMDVIATNLANANTSGFKAESMIFSEFLEPTSKSGPPLSMVYDVTFLRDMSEGTMKGTNNPLDLAISGEGYFAVDAPQGERYTRLGAFQLDNQGQIVTLAGSPVLSAGGGPITIPPGTSTITITRDGTVSADAVEIGNLRVVTFAEPQALSKDGNGLYDPKGQAPQPTAEAVILQGMIEGSNVKGVVEMTRMIKVVRSYQAAGKMAENEHKRILDAIQIIVGN